MRMAASCQLASLAAAESGVRGCCCLRYTSTVIVWCGGAAGFRTALTSL